VSTSTVASLVASILQEAVFDASETQAVKWLNARHRLMCGRTRCFRKRLELGTTIGGQQSYPLPLEVLEIHEVLVESSEDSGSLGVPYGAGLHSDLAQGGLGYLWLGGIYQWAGGGIYARDDSLGGEDLLALFPVPEEDGRAITLTAVCRPPDLEPGGNVVTPPEFDDALVEGAIATGLRRLENRPDLAQPKDAIFDEACQELLGIVNRRYRGSGPATIRIRGVNATG